jgi:hypothetical protein
MRLAALRVALASVLSSAQLADAAGQARASTTLDVWDLKDAYNNLLAWNTADLTAEQVEASMHVAYELGITAVDFHLGTSPSACAHSNRARHLQTTSPCHRFALQTASVSAPAWPTASGRCGISGECIATISS